MFNTSYKNLLYLKISKKYHRDKKIIVLLII